MYYLGVKDGGLVLFFLFCLFCELANCKGRSIKTHLVNNKLFSKSHQSRLMMTFKDMKLVLKWRRKTLHLRGWI